MTIKKKHLLLIDGMALLFRAYFATAVHHNFMYNKHGQPTNGVSGFLKHLLTAVSTVLPTHVMVCWDMGSKTVRNEWYQDYKANRPEAPVELIPQFSLAKDVVAKMGIPNVGLEGYEADDCIGTLAGTYKNNMKVTILTGDKDLLQLLDENVEVMTFQKGIGNYNYYTRASFEEEYGFHPQCFIDVKALMGDSSDNYPGVKGIGEKTAIKLIATYKSIDSILENLQELTNGQRKKLEADLENLQISRKLARIMCDAPIDCSLEEANCVIDKEMVEELILDLDIKGILNFIEKIDFREAI